MFENQEINVLYIEDNDSVAKLVFQYLKIDNYSKYNVTHKKTLTDSLEYLKNTNLDDIDVILMDLNLPNSHGINTYLQVRNHSLFLPIVIISGFEDLACKCVKLGAQDYLIKDSLSVGILTRSLQYAIERVKLERKYMNVIQTSSLGYHLYEKIDGKLIFKGYNKAANEILKLDNDQFLDKEISEAFPTLSQKVIDGYMKAIDGTPYTRQIIEYNDDRIKNSNFIVNAYKTSLNNLAVTFEDITEKIKAQKNLKESEYKYRHLVEVTKAGIYELDFINDKFIYVNDVICEKTGFTREELLDMGPLDILTEESAKKWINRYKALKNGEYVDASAEYQIIKKDGSLLWVLIVAEYIEDENNIVTGANVVAIDIHNKKVMEDRLQEHKEKVYSQLENKIHQWREETKVKLIRQERQLDNINGEIISMVSIGEVM